MNDVYATSRVLRLETGREVCAVFSTQHPDPTKPTCILLHGNPGSIEDWGNLMPLLASFANVVAVDLPGFGRSPVPKTGTLGLQDLANDVLALLAKLPSSEPIFLVGHSHGGGVAATVAATAKAPLAGVVLVGTLGFPAHQSYTLLSLPGVSAVMFGVGRMLQLGAFRRLSCWLLRQAMKPIFSPEPVSELDIQIELQLLSSRPSILQSMVEVTKHHPSRFLEQVVSQIHCPTMFIHGESDALVPLQAAKNVHQALQKHRIQTSWETIANAGHMVLRFQAPELARIIQNFFMEILH